MSAITDFETTYELNGVTYRIVGQRPTGGSGLPVFLYFTGTGEAFQPPVTRDRLTAMAARGFAASEVEYYNDLNELACTAIWQGSLENRRVWARKSSQITPLVLDVVCSLSFVSCDAGVAMSGHSQGAAIAYLSAQYDRRVTAILSINFNMHECEGDKPVLKTYRSTEISTNGVTPNKRLLVLGEADPAYAETPASCWGGLTGTSSPQSGTAPTQPGYIIVPDGGHSFDQPDSVAIDTTPMKCAYREGTQPWALPASYDWLARTASPTKHITNATVAYKNQCSSEDISYQRKAGMSVLLTPCSVWAVLGPILGTLAVIILVIVLVCLCKAKRWVCFAKKPAEGVQMHGSVTNVKSKSVDTDMPSS